MKMPQTIPTFESAHTLKEQVLKIGEEQNEVFSAYENYIISMRDGELIRIVDECCDVIQATCNLVAMLGVDDLTAAMGACMRRNRDRGRFEAMPCGEEQQG